MSNINDLKEQYEIILNNLRACNEQLLDVLAQCDDLRAQLAARTAERDEARRVAEAFAPIAAFMTPAPDSHCIFCLHEVGKHTTHCPVTIVDE